MQRRDFFKTITVATAALGIEGIVHSVPKDDRHLLFLGTCAGLEHDGDPTGPRDIHGYCMLYMPPDTVIDFAAEARDKMRYWGVDEERIENVLITHSHFDHFDAPAIIGFAQDRWEAFGKKTNLWSGETVVQALQPAAAEAEAEEFLVITEVRVGDRIPLGKNLAAIVLPSSHWTAPTPVYFLLEFRGREILYAVDSSVFSSETLACLEGHHLDAVIADCTWLEEEVDPKTSGHMNYKMVAEQMAELRARGIATDSTPCHITHMALRTTADYMQFSPGARGHGLRMAYDGMAVYFP